MKWPIVFVEWLDTRGDFGWVDTGGVQHRAAVAHQVGYLIHKDDDVITVIDSYVKDHTGVSYGNPTSIPTACIVKMKVIKK